MLRQTEIDWPEASMLGRMPLERVIVAGPLSEASALRIMSGVEFLSGYSRLHADYPPDTLERRVMPSLPLAQFRYYTDRRGVPLAFRNWAWLNRRILDEALRPGATSIRMNSIAAACRFSTSFSPRSAIAARWCATFAACRSLPAAAYRRSGARRAAANHSGRASSTFSSDAYRLPM